MVTAASPEKSAGRYGTQMALADYAVIGDCRTAALISRWGSIDWLCLPDFSDPSIFAALLDRDKGGRFDITLVDAQSSARRYLPDTAVLETTMRSAEGAIRITDCMPVIADTRHSGELQPLREILRRVEIIAGAPKLEVTVEARPDYGRQEARFRFRGRLGWALTHGRFLLNMLSNFPFEPQDEKIAGKLTGKTGDIFWFSLTLTRNTPAVLMPIGGEADRRIEATGAWWKKWSSQCRYEGAYREQVVRSAITLRLLTFTLSGALLAAATTSLPEKIGGWMNWDYRYCWPRDSALALSAFIDLSLHDEVDGFFEWLMLTSSLTSPRLHVMYDVYGNYRIDERLLPHLPGYKNSAPVRVGNKLQNQLQHDVRGEVMLAIENWIRRFGKPESYERSLIQSFAKATAKTWREPDNGIWEIRDLRRHYTYSKVMAWYVFDSSLHLDSNKCIAIPADRYRTERDFLRQQIETRGFNKKRNSYVGVFDGATLDASLLLLPRCGYVDYRDPRMTGTWDALRADLEQNGLILRYPPGFGHSQPGEAAFVICNFWAVDYLTGCGRYDDAEERLNRLIGLANDVGLYSEGIDPSTHEMLGNMPQSFSHAGLINSVLMLDRCRQGKNARRAA